MTLPKATKVAKKVAKKKAPKKPKVVGPHSVLPFASTQSKPWDKHYFDQLFRVPPDVTLGQCAHLLNSLYEKYSEQRDKGNDQLTTWLRQIRCSDHYLRYVRDNFHGAALRGLIREPTEINLQLADGICHPYLIGIPKVLYCRVPVVQWQCDQIPELRYAVLTFNEMGSSPPREFEKHALPLRDKEPSVSISQMLFDALTFAHYCQQRGGFHSGCIETAWGNNLKGTKRVYYYSDNARVIPVNWNGELTKDPKGINMLDVIEKGHELTFTRITIDE